MLRWVVLYVALCAAQEVAENPGVDLLLGLDDECDSTAKAGNQCALSALQLQRNIRQKHLDASKCKFTTFSLAYGSTLGVFALPGDAIDGDTIAKDCDFENASYPLGKVNFVCRAGAWHYESASCTFCEAGAVSAKLGNSTGTFKLPAGHSEGAERMVPCMHQEDPNSVYKYGMATFACQNAKWELKHQSCAVCGHGYFKLRYPDEVGNFSMPSATEEGVHIKQPCVFSKYPFGEVDFECTPHGWSYQGDTCAACPATTLEVQQASDVGNFSLPRTLQRGLKMKQNCTFGEKVYNAGAVEFACTDNGWKFESADCASCRGIKRFAVTYGKDEGVFTLPVGPSEGVEETRPCSFGQTTYQSGDVKFACVSGHWQLKAVTCMNGTLIHNATQ